MKMPAPKSAWLPDTATRWSRRTPMFATPPPPIGSGSSGEMGGMNPPVMVRPVMVAAKLANTRVMPVPSTTVAGRRRRQW